MTATGTTREKLDTQVAVVGAGPYGLAVSASLVKSGVDHVSFGQPMSFWAKRMPAGMVLRSSWDASHIASSGGQFSLDAYQAQLGYDIPRPVPLDTFVQYGRWFQAHAVPNLQNRVVDCIEPGEPGFRLTLDDGSRLRAGRVVIATGLDTFPIIPEAFRQLTPLVCSHATALTNPRDLKGKRVAVIGGGQSALETAALVSEAGATVQVLVRNPRVHWLGRSMKLHQQRGFVRSLLYPPTDVGPPGLNQIVSRPLLWRKFPRKTREVIAYRSIRPAGAGWLVPRLSSVDIRLGAGVVQAEESYGMVSMRLASGQTVEADHVLLGTGFSVDVKRYPFVNVDLLDQLRTRDGYPMLTRGFETSVSGLHIVGAPSARSFGPVMRFVSGTGFTIREFGAFVKAHRI